MSAMTTVTKCADFKLSRRFVLEATESVRNTRCFVVGMDPVLTNAVRRSNSSTSTQVRRHHATYRRCFLPLFRTRRAVWIGEEPTLIADPGKGLLIRKEGSGWTLAPTEAFDESFPYWVWDQEIASQFTLMLSLTVPSDEEPLVHLLSRCWDPLIYRRPSFVHPEALRHARLTSSRSNVLWLAYHTGAKSLNVSLIGSVDNIVWAYRLALSHSRAKYWAPDC